jgi:hypothetical protein
MMTILSLKGAEKSPLSRCELDKVTSRSTDPQTFHAEANNSAVLPAIGIAYNSRTETGPAFKSLLTPETIQSRLWTCVLILINILANAPLQSLGSKMASNAGQFSHHKIMFC